METRESQRLEKIENEIKSLVNAIYSREGIPQAGSSRSNESGMLARLTKLEADVKTLQNLQHK